jgi:Flp pilus assembly protein TadG
MICRIRTILKPLAATPAVLRRLSKRCDGNVALIFGLAAIPVIIAAGIAFDTGRAHMVKVRLGAALDAAALAVGSQTNETSAQLTTDLENFFYNNYCKSVPGGSSVTQCATTVAGETNVTVQPTTSITAATVTYQAQATVPMTFMQLVGFTPITVSVTAQTTKFPGMEIALVLDNTGSMLCNSAAQGPFYSPCGPTTSDTACATPGANPSRICTLIPAAQQFISTIQAAITGPQSIYVSVVPYVTTVNVGSSLCSGGTCSHITTDSCSGDFTSERLDGTSGVAGQGNLIYDQTQTPVTPSETVTVTATTSYGSKSITNVSPNTSGLAAGMSITGTGIPSGTTISSITNGTQFQLSNNAASSGSGRTLTATGGTATTANGSKTVTFAQAPSSALTTGMVVTGNGIPSNTAIQTVNSSTQITLCNAATATASNVSLSFYTPVTFDSTFNTASPTGSSTTKNWGGCVVEPTSSGEMVSGTGALATTAMTDPDTSEPSSGSWPSWYPFWWPSSNASSPLSFASNSNNWSPVSVQDTTDEIQGSISSYDTLYGPNQGCPSPLLPLTDLTTSAGQTAINNAITNMWPRDSGGTQVHIGMIWGWRTLSPYGPFAANNGHPLSYTTASSEGWKKIVVLMTDGTEEWPTAGDYTGLGPITDGKIGTTSYGSAPGNLDTRLQTLCSNMAAQGIMIYTIGLGYDGQHNTILDDDCPANGGFYSPATTSNLQSVFQQVANSIVHLRLTK